MAREKKAKKVKAEPVSKRAVSVKGILISLLVTIVFGGHLFFIWPCLPLILSPETSGCF